MEQDASRPPNDIPRVVALIFNQPLHTVLVLALSLAGWAVLAWLALDMGHPLAQLTMPGMSAMAGEPGWTVANAVAVFLMWAVMMAAMMLPSALPMILTFARLGAGVGHRSRALAFVSAYLLVWALFSVVGTAAQWALDVRGWVADPMTIRSSAWVAGLLLVIAGIYQFSPLKKMCLAYCRTPLGFVLGSWKPGVGGAFRMGARHGLTCVGCCWALMALLFVGGVMNLAWVAALAIAVAIEKMAPGGDRLARVLGLALIAAGLIKLVALVPMIS